MMRAAGMNAGKKGRIMHYTPQIEFVDFKVPPIVGTTIEFTDGTTWTLAEVLPPHVRLRWQAPCPKKPGGRVYMETALAFDTAHMDLGRDQELSRYFAEPPKLGTVFRDRFGWAWKTVGALPSPLDERCFDIVWVAECPATGGMFVAVSGRRVWGSKLHRSKVQGELGTDPATGESYVVVLPDASRKAPVR
jgi:hypothetical protein